MSENQGPERCRASSPSLSEKPHDWVDRTGQDSASHHTKVCQDRLKAWALGDIGPWLQ